MLNHVTIRASDRVASERFYETVLKTIGLEKTYSGEHFAEWGDFSLEREGPDRRTFAGSDGSFSVVSGTPTEHLHMAFTASDNATVDAFRRVATDAGYRDNGPPGERPVYHPGYYGAFVLDPDGNNIEVVNHNR